MRLRLFSEVYGAARVLSTNGAHRSCLVGLAVFQLAQIPPQGGAADAQLPGGGGAVAAVGGYRLLHHLAMMLSSVREVSVLITAAGCAAGALRRLRSLESRSATLLLRM